MRKLVGFILVLFVLVPKVGFAEVQYNQVSGKTHYMLQCQGCHKPNGEGVEGEVPDLSDPGAKLLAIEAGRKFFVAVPGSANAPLSDQQLSDVLNYIVVDILGEQANGSGIKLYTKEEVTKFRRHKILDVIKTREDLVRLVSDKPQ